MHLLLTTDTDRKIDADGFPPYTLLEQTAWERQFRAAFMAVERAGAEHARAAAAGEEPDPELAMRIEWVLWFAWFRLRRTQRGLPRFEAWLETITAVDVIPDPGDDLDEPEGFPENPGPPDLSVDPTPPEPTPAPGR